MTYYLKQKLELDAYLKEREQRAKTMRKLIQARNDQAGIRKRLLSIRDEQVKRDERVKGDGRNTTQ